MRITTDDPAAHRLPPLILAGAGLGYGIVANFLLYRQSPGLGFLLAIALGLALIVGLSVALRVRPSLANLWLPVAVLLCAGAIFARTNTMLLLMNLLAIAGLGALMLFSWTGRPVFLFALADFVWANLVAWFSLALRPLAVLVGAGQAAERPRAARLAMPLARGLAIGIPLLCIFTALFASADRVFAGYIDDVFSRFSLADLTLQPIFVALLAWLAIGSFDLALGPSDRRPSPGEIVRGVSLPRLGFAEATIALVLVDALFLAFVTIQLQYLFLGPESLALRGGVTSHAQYAREGFFQLLVAAFLTLGVIWILEWLTRRDRLAQRTVFNALATVMVGGAVVMLVSSFRRLYLYELEFGFTQDRLFPHAVTIWLGVVLLCFVVALWTRRKQVLASGLLAACLLFVFGMNLINPDAFNAARNVERFTDHGKPLDIDYLGRLSTDATPVLVQSLELLPQAPRSRLTVILQHQQRRLTSGGDWQSTNLANLAAREALDAAFGPASP